MPTRFFALNTLTGVNSLTSFSNVTEVTTAILRDTAYVASAIAVQVSHNFRIIGPFLDGSTSISTEFYLRFDAYNGNRNATNAWVIYTAAGANAYRLIASSVNVLQFQYWNSGTSAWVNWGSTWVEVASVLYTYTLKLNPANSFTWYRNGTAVATGSAPTNAASSVGIFEFGSMNDLGQTYYSQIMCADYDIRTSHLFSRLPSAGGNYNTDGTGAFSDVNEATSIDDGGAINLPATGQKRTFTKASITLPIGLTIKSMVVNARMLVIGGTVTNAKIKCRSGTTDTNSANVSPSAAYEARSAEFTVDPNTSGAWAQSGFNSAEFGVESV
jgi:hypothetical protein